MGFHAGSLQPWYTRWSFQMHREHGVVVLLGTLPGASYAGHLGHTTSQSQWRNFSQLLWRQQDPLWEGQCIQCHCDNLAVVHAIHSRSSQHGHMMHLLRCLVFFEAFYRFSLTCTYPGEVKWIGWWLISWQISLFLFQGAWGVYQPNSSFTDSHRCAAGSQDRLALSNLDAAVYFYCKQGLAEST